MIDIVVENMEKAEDDVKKGNDELNQAQEYQKDREGWVYCCFKWIVKLLVAGLAIVLIVWFVGTYLLG